MPYAYRQSRSNPYARPKTQRSSSNRKFGKQYINPARFVKPASIVEEIAYVPTNSFSDFKMHDLILENIKTKGFVNPSPIQDQSIPHGLEGKDILGIANTGTGKTLAFAIPMLNRLLQEPGSRALIMAPTRELAQQIQDECRMIAKRSGLTGALLIGGSSMGPQLQDLRHKPRIIIGTPGRIKDHMERGTLRLNDVNMVVLDEVDRMLDMGFINDMREILKELHTERQSFFFSATMDSKVQTLINTFSTDPIVISVKTGETSENVEQDVVTYGSSNEKIEKLHDLLNSEKIAKVLLFDDTQRAVERLHNELTARGFKTDAIHGGKSQGQRQRALNKFKSNEVTILVATDVAARGIDVKDITHVINFSTPGSYEDYVHRIGRAGRAGRKGYALTFIEA